MGYFEEDTKIDVHQPLATKDRWVLDAPVIYYSAEQKMRVAAPIGFDTDFASVPWLARLLVPKSGKYNAAAVIHDFLCRCNQIPRKQADKMFYEAMTSLDVGVLKRGIMYLAVRLGSLWHNPKPLDKSCKRGNVRPMVPNV